MSQMKKRAEGAVEEVVGAVKKVTDIVSEIAAASHEQSSGIEQVNKAVMQLDELTQQNAALVEEASAASQAMADQARGLNGAMQRYRVRATEDEAASPALPLPMEAKAVEARSSAERRGTARPWSGKGNTRPAAEPAPAKARVANGDDEAVWKDF
jgi:hypothetical protein